MAQATEANSVSTKIEDALASLRRGTAPDEDAEVQGHQRWYSDENLKDAIAKVQFGGGGGEHLRPVAPSSNHREVSWTMWAVEPIDDEARGLPALSEEKASPTADLDAGGFAMLVGHTPLLSVPAVFQGP